VKTAALVADVVTEFKTNGRIVIVGASLAGLRAAEALRDEDFNGKLTIFGDEKHEPYDRPPLSKQVLKGWVRADHTKLPRTRKVDADWRLGVAATGLDRATKQVLLANGDRVPFDRLLIATGTRARPWFNPKEAALKGVFTLRTSDDAAKLQAALAAGPAAGPDRRRRLHRFRDGLGLSRTRSGRDRRRARRGSPCRRSRGCDRRNRCPDAARPRS
jgi:NADPH-dependent 2,4-dienoyl-CoA reductase/sulfur reductase-like enzyme